MKLINIAKNLIGMSILFFCVSCADLSENLTGQPTTDKFFHNLTDFESFISGAYTQLVRLYGSDYYSSISQCNTMIQVISQNTDVPKEKLLSIDGEARFLRAFNYFQLVRWFGEVPLLTEENQTNAAQEPQSTIAQIYDQIVDDLKVAETTLPDTHDTPKRPSRWAAKALLAKVYLAMAGFPLNETSNYALARDKAKEVIDKKMYRLENNFFDLWLWVNRITNSEFIFAIYASSDNGTGSYVNRAVRPWDHGENGWGDWTSDKRFLENYPEGDSSRLKGTFYLTMIDGTSWENTDYAQPYVGKLRDGGAKIGGYYDAALSSNGDGFFCMLRYSDILLIYAEAANQAEGAPSKAAYNAINEVRERAGMANLSNLSMSQFDKAVLDERNWELAFECNRWFDLCRRHILKETMSVYYPDAKIDDHNYLLPKPNDQLSIMIGLQQNPGY